MLLRGLGRLLEDFCEKHLGRDFIATQATGGRLGMKSGSKLPACAVWRRYAGGVMETSLELSLREKIRRALVEEVPEAPDTSITPIA
jgi:hypothetical protein